jgi:hypothetical protein
MEIVILNLVYCIPKMTCLGMSCLGIQGAGYNVLKILFLLYTCITAVYYVHLYGISAAVKIFLIKQNPLSIYVKGFWFR